ncbi:acyl-CoA reductase [Dyadobacter luteus]|uniref:Acyl-CoA reductase n=1 Tax=Dyadobacter luteus TaxID=2259619 RepID=A0A3D8YC00_9BACT|nr:acyl-CoA reductase [Dyadobacter luteus]REA59713.1 acyl-CoA reductase [Dyadobacter luteus]
MISRKSRVDAFVKLGTYINSEENTDEIEKWIAASNSKNNWFTPANVRTSLEAIASQYLDRAALEAWVEKYTEPVQQVKVGVVMAGNIPAVGFHDALCVLISGHTLLAKPASDDQALIHYLLEKLVQLEPAFGNHIRFVERLNEADAYIATGSDNTARYFHYYFSKKPHVIRKNRTSVAILDGQESTEELTALGKDIFQYFGLGCRNVSKLFVPAGYDFSKLYESLEVFRPVCVNHHKYFNNYEYNRSILLVNRIAHFDNGFLIFNESPALVSPISVVHFEFYDGADSVKAVLEEAAEKIQCIVSGKEVQINGAVGFGEVQSPGLEDYADAVDTMAFLSSL